MKRTMLYLLVFGFAISLTATSCKKGDAGAQGEKGDKGDQGIPGTSGIYYSAWIPTTIANTGLGTVPATKITADILNKGDVRVFINLNTEADPEIYALPHVEPMATQAEPDKADWVLDLALKVGNIYLFSNYTANNLPVRYIVIPGGTNTRSSINWNDYNEVKKALNLKD